MPRRLALVAAFITVVLCFAGNADHAHAQTAWTIKLLSVTYHISNSGDVAVTEDIDVDFGTAQHHGIFRDMPLEYDFDSGAGAVLDLDLGGVDLSGVAVRQMIRIAGVIVGVLGGLMMYGFGKLFGGALVGVPLIVAGVLLLLLANAFPRRTGTGRVLYRRSLGFRRFMVESDAPREKFAENANIFHDYLPYAIVYGCVDRWAKVFKDLGIDTGTPSYYVGAGPFIAASFADSMTSFSSSISSTMASTPGGSGGSGFGGGSGGGGGGGGGGGAW